MIRGMRTKIAEKISEINVNAGMICVKGEESQIILWKKVSSSSQKATAANVELCVDFVANKMNKAWSGLEKAPPGSFKSKIHGVELSLLSRVKPSEIFLKSIPKQLTGVEVVFPSSLNARLVRRRLRHIAMRGTIVHKNYFYGSVTLLPITSAFAVDPKQAEN
ncbi:hypothetical protein L2E82_44846 [Cichorium intybus]|uniref:Uncharacterized protein n=1 Tax=Cichorium intybus TaxID=13427 RepID=A0ACB8ZVS6_CICIN|nr:hypothetical protein L2E82_44846 [Cichorium intybus]